ncbi:MAG: Prephenate dehydratase [uncultured Solirubrobacteraceae bacterium]|uniref:Prephenate dehydratase n=1 Tax=uncultured Solirubrobacteraceae bacterium TaxID=1162706 RepID=A0A6J4RAH9_9ACTN|nr:MAG: Prephenate dehydratase [uncultured Solirubrobacteraceae bacterium]
MRAGYLGPPGTFTHEAVKASGRQAGMELVPMPTIYDTILAVHDGDLDRALVPIENSLEGSVNVTLDALALEARDVEIVGEVVHPISHCLLARERVPLSEVRAVVSHPQASAQCARFIRAHLPAATVIPASSTADAVRRVAEGAEADRGPWAALGTRAAGELYGCVVLRDAVEDRAGNETRFIWIARRGAAPEPAADVAGFKTSLVFWGVGADTPGWLVRCLSEFAFRGVNLTRIESRPLKEGLGRYMFFLDCDGAMTSPMVAQAVAAVRGHAEEVRVLGSYPAAG